jgi:hypothetical protein
VSEVVGVGFEIHITQMYHLTCGMALLKELWWKGIASCVRKGALWIDDSGHCSRVNADDCL